MLGIQNGAVLQRGDDNTCNIFLSENVNEAFFESNGRKTSAGLEKTDVGTRLYGIPTGGPYTVMLDGQSFSDVYVGDLWILAGQSNMEGNGFYRSADETASHGDDIRALYPSRKWETAHHPLHTIWASPDRVHRALPGLSEEVITFKGVGPGMAFAKRLREIFSVPQGLICCAHGGTKISQWDPDLFCEGEDSLFWSMCESIKTAGGNVRGLFWSQGCSEGMCGDENSAVTSVASYTEDTLKFFRVLREYLGKDIPIVMTQIARLYGFDSEGLFASFSSIKEQQRVFAEKLSNALVVPTINCSLDDIVHLDSDSQDRIGAESADAMAALLGKNTMPPIRLSHAKLETEKGLGHTRLSIYFENVSGSLDAKPRPEGFSVSNERWGRDGFSLFDSKIEQNRVVLRISEDLDSVKEKFVCYGMGLRPCCNVCDSKGRSIPAFSVRISDILK